MKVAKWIEDNNVQPYWDASERFQNLFPTLFDNGLVLREGGDRAIGILWNLAAGILYDFDSLEFVTKEFPQNRTREDGEEDLRLLGQLLQRVKAIAVAVPQVKKMAECEVR